ncbi:aspartyl/asparaginyl beta-hydroxylase domain-containing protein [Pseudomonas sp. TE50-2]|uniref:aspartyl/asparaginyl beta-hydroxylase domain-containing protein n=1 Tax=Pseudomonas sp. TE50-2 TaxID=3142707 RepID=UPI003465CE52
MSKKTRKTVTSLAVFVVVVFAAYSHTALVGVVVALYAVCGLYDFARSGVNDAAIIKKYFLGGGRNTWILSPLNTLMDLISKPNKHIYKLHELPDECSREVRQVIDLSMKYKSEIISYLETRLHSNKRGMLFFQWYGRQTINGLDIPELRQRFKYIKTVGVSVFNDNQSTSFHFGPLRMMLRVLYNISPPRNNDGVYIQVKDHKHYWHDHPLFIFDDTLLHASFNKGGGKRYCLFVDIIRPTYAYGILNGIVMGFSRLVYGLRRAFYKNWKSIE